jgi:hypothetical protein
MDASQSSVVSRSEEPVSGALRQINLKYEAEHDRLLLRIRAGEDEEVRLWLTRRYVSKLWPALFKVLEKSPRVSAQASPVARQAVVAFQHQDAVARADFKRGYEEGKPRAAQGEAPLLVNASRFKLTDPARPVLSFQTVEGKQLTINLNVETLHSFCRLLQQAARAADWGLTLDFVGDAGAATPGEEPPQVH